MHPINSINTSNNTLINLQDKWSKGLNDEIRINSSSFKNANKYSPVYQHFFHFKLLHRGVVHNRLHEIRAPKHQIAYILVPQKLLNTFILIVVKLDCYGRILKTGLDCHIILSSKLQILKRSLVKNKTITLNTLLSSVPKMLYIKKEKQVNECLYQM